MEAEREREEIRSVSLQTNKRNERGALVRIVCLCVDMKGKRTVIIPGVEVGHSIIVVLVSQVPRGENSRCHVLENVESQYQCTRTSMENRGGNVTNIDTKFRDGAIVDVVCQILAEVPMIKRHNQGIKA